MKPKKFTKSLLAEHEVAHAVMRKLVDLPATKVWIDGEEGMCEGTGEIIGNEEALLVTLAGIASELPTPSFRIDWEDARFTFVDAGTAWDLVSKNQALCVRGFPDRTVIIEDPVDTLHRWLARAVDMLEPHQQLIKEMGRILHDEGEISADSVADHLRSVTPTVWVNPDFR
jgi:hypothetical protein